MDRLLQESYQPEIKKTRLSQALIDASILGLAEIVKLLLAQADMDVNTTDSAQRTLRMFAAENGHIEVSDSFTNTLTNYTPLTPSATSHNTNYIGCATVVRA